MSGDSVKNWHKHCLLPDGTELQEHSIKTDRDIMVGEFCQIDYGLRGKDIYVGESTTIREYVWASGDARIGNLCEIGSDVIAKQDAYIGEGVKIPGKLVVSGTLDIGEKVEIAQGFRGDRRDCGAKPDAGARLYPHLPHDDAQDREREGTRPDP